VQIQTTEAYTVQVQFVRMACLFCL